MADRRQSTASQETLISLQQIEPSPIESPAPDAGPEKQLPDLPPPHQVGLSGSRHGVAYYLIRAQKYSSYIFTLYAAVHLTNTSLIPLYTRSVAASETYLLLTRPYYQSIPLEPLLITLPITTHILSGLALRIHRRNGNLKRYGAAGLPVGSRFEHRVRVWPIVSWSSVSGYVLAPLVLGHAFVNRTLPWIYEGGSSGVGLGYVAHGFARHPVLAWTGYVALVGTAAGHFVWGAARWQGWVEGGSGKKARRRWWVINGIAAAVAGLWMVGGLGVVGRGGASEGWIGQGYDMLYSKVPLVKL